MADPAPSAPLPDAERRLSPADQMAALTGDPVDLPQPDDEEPAEDRDASTTPQIDALGEIAPFQRTAPVAAGASNDSTKSAPATTTDSAETPVSPPAPSETVASAAPPPAPHVTPPGPASAPGAKATHGQTSPVAPAPVICSRPLSTASTARLLIIWNMFAVMPSVICSMRRSGKRRIGCSAPYERAALHRRAPFLLCGPFRLGGVSPARSRAPRRGIPSR